MIDGRHLTETWVKPGPGTVKVHQGHREVDMLARIRMTIPDQPGWLGAVATAIGSAGGDILQFEVLSGESGRATDDVWVKVSGETHLARVVTALAALRGLDVNIVHAPAQEVSGMGALELVRCVLEAGDLSVLVDQAAASLDLSWVSVLELVGPDRGEVLASSPGGPVPGDRLTVLPRLVETPAPTRGTMLVVPLDRSAGVLLLAREDGPTFHSSEAFRLGELGRILDLVLTGLAEAVPIP